MEDKLSEPGGGVDVLLRVAEPDIPLLEVVDELDQVRQRSPEPIEQVIVNEYLPRQGIASHVDHPECFGQTVAILSLGSGVLMDFKQRDGSRRVSQLLKPGSLLILRGNARYRWEHGIASRKSDRIGRAAVRRGRRVSLTFRSVRPSG